MLPFEDARMPDSGSDSNPDSNGDSARELPTLLPRAGLKLRVPLQDLVRMRDLVSVKQTCGLADADGSAGRFRGER